MPRSTFQRIAIVGVGAVGSTTAYSLLHADAVDELVLADLDRARAEGEAMDLAHSIPFARPANIRVAGIDEVADCDLLIVTAGAAQRPGESRLALVRRNADIFRTFFPALTRRNPEAFVLVVTNPVDVMTRVALKLSGLPPERVFGSGTTLDTARFRQSLSMHFNVSAADVDAQVVGEHGDSEVLVWSRANIGPLLVHEYARSCGTGLTDRDRARIDDEVRRAAYEIIERKGATHFAIGSACTRLAQALRDPRESIHSVSRRMEGQYGLSGVCLSLPTLVGSAGAVRSIEMPLAEDEHAALLRSAAVLQETWSATGLE